MKIEILLILGFIINYCLAECGTFLYPHSCWKYCFDNSGKWCWTQQKDYCYKNSDCYSDSSCYSTCKK